MPRYRIQNIDRKTNKPAGPAEGSDDTEMIEYKGKMYPKGWAEADNKFSSGRSSGGRPLPKEKLIVNIIDGFKRAGRPLLTAREVKKVDADIEALSNDLKSKEADVKATKAKLKAKKAK